MKETLFVSFSGGRTSAYMCWYLLEFWGHKYNFIFVFANTGLEHEETLIFVDRCDKAFGLNLVYVEAVVHPKGTGNTHKIVTFETAARNGEPYEAYIKKEGIPNISAPKCSERLKTKPMESYRRSLGYRSKHKTAIGYRVDEIDRMKHKELESGSQTYPLISLRPTTKPEIVHWWAEQSFDLEIPEHLGNCVTCFKKSNRKLMTIAKHEPQRFAFMARMEKECGSCGPSGETGMTFFRGRRSSKDIIASSKQPFVEFVKYKPELQLKMPFDINPLDLEGDCGAASCEI